MGDDKCFRVINGGRFLLQGRSLVTVALGAACTVFISSLFGASIPVNAVGSEIIARTHSNLINLGIAIVAGAAGSFSLTRHNIARSIAGVAIAVALVPPLCVMGIGFGIGQEMVAHIHTLAINYLDVSAGAFLLFIVNLAGITFTACLVFLSQSYGSLNKAFQTILIWLLIIGLLCGPLTGSMKEIIVTNEVQVQIRKLREERPEIAQQTQTRHLEVKLEGTTAYVTILTIAPEGLLTDEYIKLGEKRVFDALTKIKINFIEFCLHLQFLNVHNSD